MRHSVLIGRLEQAGLQFIAPEFGMMQGLHPTMEDLLQRIDLIGSSLSGLSPDTRIFGIGHSIGASLLLAMAGAAMWLGPGRRLPVDREERLRAIALLAPPVGFFQAPGALDTLDLPIFLRSGGADKVSPASTHRQFLERLPQGLPVDFRVEEKADHFSFMDQRPPKQDPEFPEDEAALRERLHDELVALAVAV